MFQRLAQLMDFWPVLLFVVQGFGAWILWSTKKVVEAKVDEAEDRMIAKHAELAAAIDVHDTKLTQHESAIAVIQGDLVDLPTKADLARVEGAVKAVEREVTATGAGVSRLESFFLKRGVEGVG